MALKDTWAVVKQSGKEFSEDKASRLAAALAFYTIFALAPLLLIAISIAGLVLGHQAAQGQIVGRIASVVGKAAAGTIQAMIASASSRGAGIVALVLGAAALLWAAGGFFGQLKEAMNTIWEVKEKPGLGVWGFLRSRLRDFAMVMGVAVILLIALLISAGLNAFAGYFSRLFTGGAAITQIGDFIISFGIVWLLFAVVYKYLPDAEIQWRDVWFGAFVTALLFTVGKYLIGLYLAHSKVQTSYGAAGSLVLILLWVYYSAQIMLFGAEITQVRANQFGAGVQPSEEAEPLTPEDRAQQGRPPEEEQRQAA